MRDSHRTYQSHDTLRQLLERDNQFTQAEQHYMAAREAKVSAANAIARHAEHNTALPGCHQDVRCAKDVGGCIPHCQEQRRRQRHQAGPHNNNDASVTQHTCMCTQVAYDWVVELGVPSGVKLLAKLNLLDAVIDVACERTNFGVLPEIDVPC